MIKFHPEEAWLKLHAQGELSLSVALGISAHCELCEQCRDKVNGFTEHFAEVALNNSTSLSVSAAVDTILEEPDWSHMLETITSKEQVHSNLAQNAQVQFEVKNQHFYLPKVFRQFSHKSWQGIGKVSRMRLVNDDDPERASLLHIEAMGEIPEHTHKGHEITLILSGDFEDEFNQYVVGDYLVLDSNHRHSPKTRQGCLCFTVVDAPLHFTKGMSKLLNPIGELIY